MINHPSSPASPAVTAAAKTTTAGTAARPRVTLDLVWLLMPPLLTLAVFSFQQVPPHDLWWHLRTGQIIADTRAIPTVDLLTFTRAGEPWTNQAWLSQLLFYLLYQAGGLSLLVFANAVMMAGGYAFVEAACLWGAVRRAPIAAVATIVAMFMGFVSWNVRPQSISFLLFGILVFILERHRVRGDRLIWLLPSLFALWANLHGAFVFGIGLLIICTSIVVLSDLVAHRRVSTPSLVMLLVTSLSVLALGLNPQGPLGMVRYFSGFLHSSATMQNNVEFQPLTIRTLDGMVFFGSMLALVLLTRAQGSQAPLPWLGTLLVFGVMTLYSRRVGPWYGMALAPALAMAAGASIHLEPGRGQRAGRAALNHAILALLIVAPTICLPWLRPLLPLKLELQPQFQPALTPTAAVSELCRWDSSTRTFSDIGFSSYLEWACPDLPVFMDTRFELYPEAMWKDYLLISAGRFGWQHALARYGANTIFTSKQEQPTLVEAARASNEWQIEYEDGYSALFRKR